MSDRLNCPVCTGRVSVFTGQALDDPDGMLMWLACGDCGWATAAVPVPARIREDVTLALLQRPLRQVQHAQ